MTKRGEPQAALEAAIAFNGGECLRWQYGTNGKGYGQIWRDGKTRRVNRIICEAVNGPPKTPKLDAAHSCGNRRCVNPKHLSWKTPAENMADKLIHGTHNRGERQGSAILTEASVPKIRANPDKLSQRKLAAKFGVSKSLIGMIQRGEIWGWLT